MHSGLLVHHHQRREFVLHVEESIGQAPTPVARNPGGVRHARFDEGLGDDLRASESHGPHIVWLIADGLYLICHPERRLAPLDGEAKGLDHW